MSAPVWKVMKMGPVLTRERKPLLLPKSFCTTGPVELDRIAVAEGVLVEQGREPFIGDGVVGVVIKDGGIFYIPLLAATSPGSGDVGRWLDRLPSDKHIIVPTVLGGRLARMLRARGFEQRGNDYERWPKLMVEK